MTEFFAEQDEALQEGNTGAGQTLGESESAPSAGRSLGGSSSQSPSITPQPSSTSRKSAPKKKFATLGDFSSGGGDDSEEEDDAVNQDLFAGGENMHGRFEYVSVQVMQQAIDVLLEIVRLTTEKK